MNQTFHITPSNIIAGDIHVSADKSISHRAIILSSIADGITEIDNILLSDDVLSTINIMRELGVVIEKIHPDPLFQRGETVKVYGVGKHGLKPSQNPLNCGNSGTAMRLLCGLLSAQKFNSVLIGDASLMRRPMARIAEPLRLMGAKINLSENNTAPIKIMGNQELFGIDVDLTIASAQVKSGILLASLYASGETIVREKIPTRDHTERMLLPLKKGSRVDFIKIPGDISSAAFFMVAACITPHSNLIIREVGINPFRTGIIDILKLMGADIEIFNKTFFGNEPVADIQIKYAPLHGIIIPEKCISTAIDEFPVIFIAAVTAKGKTILRGAKELRVKESDRISAMTNNFNQLNIRTEEYDDGLLIYGDQQFQGGCVDSFGDHRIAMALVIAGNVAKEDFFVDNCQLIKTSFPNFVELANQVGMQILAGT